MILEIIWLGAVAQPFSFGDSTIENKTSAPITGALLRLTVGGNDHVSDPFSVAGGAQITVPVIVGGYANLPDVSAVKATCEITPGRK